jgi:hypothetical protein
MPAATATKTKPVATTIGGLRERATADWRRWATALAATGTLPPTSELIEAAGLLGRTVDDLERDAEYLVGYLSTVRERDFWKAKCDAIDKARGPIEDVRKRIAEVEAQLAELQSLERDGYSEGWQYGAAHGKAARLRSQRPDLFEADA